jgi:hypothetical protein
MGVRGEGGSGWGWEKENPALFLLSNPKSPSLQPLSSLFPFPPGVVKSASFSVSIAGFPVFVSACSRGKVSVEKQALSRFL